MPCPSSRKPSAFTRVWPLGKERFTCWKQAFMSDELSTNGGDLQIDKVDQKEGLQERAGIWEVA